MKLQFPNINTIAKSLMKGAWEKQLHSLPSKSLLFAHEPRLSHGKKNKFIR